jgi:hypothetical protein
MTIGTGARRSHSQFSIVGLVIKHLFFWYIKTVIIFSFQIHGYIGDVVFAFVPALALHLTVEAPVNGFIKAMM